MSQFTFSALGTEWSIVVDDGDLSEQIQQEILNKTDQFDQQMSRFILTSEANKFRYAKAGTYQTSAEFSFLLHEAQILKQETNGAFDPAIGELLEHAGYDPNYRFQPNQNTTTFQLTDWKIDGQQLTIAGPIVFDIGGTGKGYWIDQLAKILQSHGFSDYIVDGGGDMVATTKQHKRPWRIALEWPGDPERAIGLVELTNQGLAVSDIYKRKWGDWHHFVDTKSLQPTKEIIWCAAVAADASKADQFTSILSLADPITHAALAKKRQVEYLALHTNGQIHASEGWPGQIF